MHTESFIKIWWLICKIFTILSNHPVVFPQSYCDIHLLRSPWFNSAKKTANQTLEINLLQFFHFIWHPRHSKGWNDSEDVRDFTPVYGNFKCGHLMIFHLFKIKPSLTFIGLNFEKELFVTIFFQNCRYLGQFERNFGQNSQFEWV